MKLLPDTCIAVWCLSDVEYIDQSVFKTLRNNDNELFVSVVSLWEMAIKIKKWNLNLLLELLSLMNSEFHVLNINLDHCLKTMSLPWIHKDPFDRMIIAQAIVEDLSVVTKDNVFPEYGVQVLMA